MRRYLVLFAITLAAAAALGALARRPRREAATAAAPAPVPVVALALAIGDDGLAPAVTTAPKDHEVRLTIENRRRSRAALALAGYEDRLAIPPLAPGERWSGGFVADRPGEDFAWLLDGRPAGRFAVQGSHLVEGHR
jgi:hypothetical protein